MSRKMSPHQQSPRFRQLQQQLGNGARNGGSPRQNGGGGARVGDVAQTPQVKISHKLDFFSKIIYNRNITY